MASRNRHYPLALLTCLFPFLTGCNPSPKVAVIEESEKLCTTCIKLTKIAEFGDESDGHLSAVMHVAIDSTGNYWASDDAGPKVFSPAGTFIRQVGRQGRGPGEYLRQGFIWVDSEGLVHAIDRGNSTENVYSPLSFALLRTRRLPGNVVGEVLDLPAGNRRVANMIVDDPAAFAEPLHLLQDSLVVRSFGLPGEGVAALSPTRRIAVGRDGSIYSINTDDYAIDIWSPDGGRLESLSRPDPWPPTSPAPLSPTDPPAPLILDLRTDSLDRLWVLIALPRANWKDNLEEIQRPDGYLSYRPRDGRPEEIFRAVMEVIDLDRREVVARAELDALPVQFVSDTLMHGMVHDSTTGAPTVAIWRVNSTIQLAEEQ